MKRELGLPRWLTSRTAVVVVLVLVMYALVPGKWAYGHMQADTKAAASTQAETLTIKGEIAKAELVKQNEATYTQRLAVDMSAIPSTPDLNGAINSIAAAVQHSGVVWKSGTPAAANAGASTAGVPAGSYTLTVGVTGGVPQITDFVAQLRDVPRLLVVSSVQISGSASSDATATVVMNVATATASASTTGTTGSGN